MNGDHGSAAADGPTPGGSTLGAGGAAEPEQRPGLVQAAVPGRPAWRCWASWTLLAGVIIIGLVADLWSKDLAFRYVAGNPVLLDRQEILEYSALDPQSIGARVLPRHAPVVIVPHVLEFTLVLNPGAVFGMGPGQRWFFLGFTGVAIAFALYMFAFWTRGVDLNPVEGAGRAAKRAGVGDWLAHAAIGLLIAGGLGNFYDRMVYGCVRDFIHPLPGLKWPFGWTLTSSTGEVWPYVSNVADAFLLVGIGILAVRLWRSEPGPAAKAQGLAAGGRGGAGVGGGGGGG